MADNEKPTANYAKGVQHLLKQMRSDAELFNDEALKPHYTYNNSSLKQSYNELANMDILQTPAIPQAVRDKVTDLDTTFKNVVKDVVKGEFKQANWDATFDAIQKDITEAKAKSDPGQDNTALEKLGEHLKTIKAEALDGEMKKMHANLKLQNDMNFENAMFKEAMSEGPYKGKGSLFMANDWSHRTGGDAYTDEETQRLKDAGVALTTGAELHNGADGIYAKDDSYYKVKKRTDADGNAHYEATYSNVPKGDIRTTAEALIDTAAIIIRFWGSISGVIPILEGLTAVMAGIGMVLTGGRLELPYTLPFTQLSKIGESLFDKREGNTHDQVKAEMDVAQRRGKERNINLDPASSPGKQLSDKDLEKLVVYIDEMKAKAGYKPGPNGTPGTISKPKVAMGLNVSTAYQDKLSALLLTKGQHLDKEADKMVRSFYKSQNNNSSWGYDASKYKEYIFKEIENYQIAIGTLRGTLGKELDKPKATDTSTITPTKGDETSTITRTKGWIPPALRGEGTSTITPTKEAGPMPDPSAPPQFTDSELAARKEAAKGLEKYVTPGQGADNLFETVKEAIAKFDEVTKAANFDRYGQAETPDEGQHCDNFKEDLDKALECLTAGEVESLEAEGDLPVYKAASERMGVAPAELSEGTIAAKKKPLTAIIDIEVPEGPDTPPPSAPSGPGSGHR